MKSKRLLVLLYTTVVLLTGCTKDEIPSPTPSVSVPSSATVNVGQTFPLGSTQAWLSSNTFVATVSNEGIITGNHVGNCVVSCSAGSCRVTVRANTNLFRDPITQWGISKSQVIAREGTDYHESGNSIGYNTENDKVPLLMYTFTNDLLESTTLMVRTAYTNEVVDHLSERYRYLGQVGSAFYFADGVSDSTSTTAVVLQYYNSSYWVVIYTKHP
jgi:hypothetical protein